MNSRSSRSGRGAADKSKRRSHSTNSSRSSNSSNNSRSSNPGSSSNARSRGKQQTSAATHGNRSAQSARHGDQPRSGARADQAKEQSKMRQQTNKRTERASRQSNLASSRVRVDHQQPIAQSVEETFHHTAHRADLPSIPVLYEDNHVIGVVKPVNIPSQADDTGDADMLTVIKQDLKQRHQKEGNVFLGLVHRLDRPVGGAMLFAKTSKGASRLSDSVRSGKLGKRYVAVLRGIPSRPQATLKDTLLKNSRTNTSAVVAPGTAGGKDAVLDYEVLATDTQANLSLVLIKLHTGRSHQIRVQMAHAGHPLFGDQRYGGGLNRPGEQLALWSVLASAPHPVKDETVCIISLPPRVKPWVQWDEPLYDKLSERLQREQD